MPKWSSRCWAIQIVTGIWSKVIVLEETLCSAPIHGNSFIEGACDISVRSRMQQTTIKLHLTKFASYGSLTCRTNALAVPDL